VTARGFHTYKLAEFIARSGDPEAIQGLALIADAKFPKLSASGPWVAGGLVRRAIQGERGVESDVDYFFSCSQQMADAQKMLVDGGASVTRQTDDTVSLSVRWNATDVAVQLVAIKYYASLTEVLDSFDFTICQCGTDGENLVVGEFTLWDIARKRLALHRLTYGTATLQRLIKYGRSGFTACSGVLSDILERAIADPSVVHREVEYFD
jgi:hypothetical protein